MPLRRAANPFTAAARIRALGAVALAIALLAAPPGAHAQLLLDRHPAETAGAEIVEKRAAQIPLDLVFTDSAGRSVALADYFDGKRPVVLILGYYDCPLLCTLVFNGAQKSFNDLAFTLGKDFRALSVSFDHTNTVATAAGRQAAMLAGYDRPVPDDAWPFLTADAASARALADSVGYRYVYMPKADEFSHAAAIVVLTPDGAVSNYLYGVEYPAKQLRLALMDAAEGKMGGVFDRILFYCHIYDPDAGSYVLQAFRVMQIGALLTVVALGGALGWLFFSGHRRRHAEERDRASVPGAQETTAHGPSDAGDAS